MSWKAGQFHVVIHLLFLSPSPWKKSWFKKKKYKNHFRYNISRNSRSHWSVDVVRLKLIVLCLFLHLCSWYIMLILIQTFTTGMCDLFLRTCHCFLQSIKTDLPSSSYTTLLLYKILVAVKKSPVAKQSFSGHVIDQQVTRITYRCICFYLLSRLKIKRKCMISCGSVSWVPYSP